MALTPNFSSLRNKKSKHSSSSTGCGSSSNKLPTTQKDNNISNNNCEETIINEATKKRLAFTKRQLGGNQNAMYNSQNLLSQNISSHPLEFITEETNLGASVNSSATDATNTTTDATKQLQHSRIQLANKKLSSRSKLLSKDNSSSLTMSDSFREAAGQSARNILTSRFKGSCVGTSMNQLPTFQKSQMSLGKRLGMGGFSNVYEVHAIKNNQDSTTHLGTATAATNDNPKSPTRLRSLNNPPLTKKKYSSMVEQSSTNSRYNHNNNDDDDIDLLAAATAKPTLSRKDTIALNDCESRQFIASHCIRASGDARYAVKLLRPAVIQDPNRLLIGLCDLAMETKFLSTLSHPNIIKLRAISSADPFSSQDYFLVLDRLYDTLETRISKWRLQYLGIDDKNNNNNKNWFQLGGSKRFAGDKKNCQKLSCTSKFWESRLVKVFDLSAALAYMHRNGIIHRDIKPENIGFDCRGDIKIFDFGMARELRRKDANDDFTYRLSAMTGTLRYMAPEVALGKPYNAGCDVYSYSILLWEVMSLELPFCKIKKESAFMKHVFGSQGCRPKFNSKYFEWPAWIQSLLQGGWTADLMTRITMVEFTKTLRRELIKLRNGDATGLEHERRRSTFVFSSAVIPPLASTTTASKRESLIDSDDDDNNNNNDDDCDFQLKPNKMNTLFGNNSKNGNMIPPPCLPMEVLEQLDLSESLEFKPPNSTNQVSKNGKALQHQQSSTSRTELDVSASSSSLTAVPTEKK